MTKTKTRKPTMLWEGKLDKPLIEQLAAIGGLTHYADETFRQMEEFVLLGVSDEEGTISLPISPLESQALSLGLNLVGFFVPAMAEVAERLCTRAVGLVEAFEPSEELMESIRRAADKKLAQQIGIEPDRLEEFLARAEADQEIKSAEALLGDKPALN